MTSKKIIRTLIYTIGHFHAIGHFHFLMFSGSTCAKYSEKLTFLNPRYAMFTIKAISVDCYIAITEQFEKPLGKLIQGNENFREHFIPSFYCARDISWLSLFEKIALTQQISSTLPILCHCCLYIPPENIKNHWFSDFFRGQWKIGKFPIFQRFTSDCPLILVSKIRAFLWIPSRHQILLVILSEFKQIN